MQFEKQQPFGPLESIDLIDFEESNEISLPDDYKEFLLHQNGGRPILNIVASINTDVNWLYGMVEEPEWASFFSALDTFEGRIPAWYIPIGTDSGGNIYIMSLYEENKGVIAIWWHEEEAKENGTEYFDNLTHIADSFDEFLNSLGKANT